MKLFLKKICPVVMVVMVSAACTIDKTAYAVFDDPALFHPSATIYDDLNLGIPAECPLSDYLEQTDTVTNGTKGSSFTINTMAKGLLSLFSTGKVESIVGTYMSVDVDGNPIRLSGRVMLPSSGDIRNIILVSHFTITADYECPSNSFQLEGLLALDGYALVIPDYIGYGITYNLVHPYLCANLTAINVVDMLDAVVPYLEKVGRAPKDTSIILMGYSQGGATTLAVQREIEQYRPEYRIKRNFAGAGPYDICATYDKSIEIDKTSIPCAIPMIIMGMNEGEHLNLDYSIFFKEKLLKNYDEWINSKKYTTKQLATLMDTDRLSDLMTDVAMQKRDSNTVYFYNAMLRNSVLQWFPQAPIYMFHSIDDDTVPYINTQLAKEAFSDFNVEYNVGHYGNHVSGCVKFLLCVHDILK